MAEGIKEFENVLVGGTVTPGCAMIRANGRAPCGTHWVGLCMCTRQFASIVVDAADSTCDSVNESGSLFERSHSYIVVTLTYHELARSDGC